MIPLDMFKHIATTFMRETCFALKKIRRVAENLPVKKDSITATPILMRAVIFLPDEAECYFHGNKQKKPFNGA